MAQNYNDANQNKVESQALVKSDKNSHALTVKGKGSLLALTDSILSSTIAARKASQLVVDDSWIQEIWDWADKFRISEYFIPRNRDKLLELTSLDLAHNELRELPKSIGNLTNLTSLELHANDFSELPEIITNLTNLTSLELSYNYLSELPESIANLTNLTSLVLSFNDFNDVPDSIINLPNLTSLDLRANYIGELPYWLDQDKISVRF